MVCGDPRGGVVAATFNSPAPPSKTASFAHLTRPLEELALKTEDTQCWHAEELQAASPSHEAWPPFCLGSPDADAKRVFKHNSKRSRSYFFNHRWFVILNFGTLKTPYLVFQVCIHKTKAML